MVGLTFAQPWASAIASSVKRIDSREWGNERLAGTTLAIHASTKRWSPTPLEMRRVRKLWPSCPEPRQLPYGAILATARVKLICEPNHPAVTGSHWASGPRCWVFDRINKLLSPVSCEGKNGLWKVPEGTQQQVEENNKERWAIRCECGSGLKADVMTVRPGEAGYCLRCVRCTGLERIIGH